ncbi:hypothetical protein [Roseobacter litoralis]|uniref:hypothetical protein n=1 Tax=Roseobacter litoralis TaxID=42443 RepID=UPI00249060DC|nr:hypothetical protein [Roseobacter litoralis]
MSRFPNMVRHFIITLLFLSLPAMAEPPKIDHVSARQAENGTWRFSVTISHPDTGWDHYADAWRVLDMDGKELGTRALAHPHVDEQPFTRSLSNVRIPEGVKRVQVQARDKPGGWNPKTEIITLK